MKRGDVYWLELPNEKRRPALVLTRDEAIPVMRKVVIAHLTSRVRGIPTEVPLHPEDGLPRECAVSLDNLRAVPKSLLSGPIASLSGPRMHEVCQALAIATGCR
ncbi:MAG TPA: type II toxin-antitoxin system PemK/MazF family toxin [Solirubrobacterales bacterium]|nr:type II toxin-antitoxin system PemK/MazF family toxin [Solirubrobacterales bacterium]